MVEGERGLAEVQVAPGIRAERVGAEQTAIAQDALLDQPLHGGEGRGLARPRERGR